MLRHVSSTPQLIRGAAPGAPGSSFAVHAAAPSSVGKQQQHRRRASQPDQHRPKVKSFQDLHSLDASDGLVGVLPRPPSPVPSSLPVLAELETPFGSPGPDALSMADIFSRLNATKATDDVSQAPDQTSAPTRASESTEPPTAPASALTAAPTLPEPLPEALAAAEAVPGFQLRVETTFTPIEKSFSDPSAATAPLTPPTALAFKPAQSLPVPQAPPKVAPATPAPTEVRIFRTHLQLNYIQEMLSSLAHAQQLAANAVTEARSGLSSAAAASASLAAGAAAMLGRGLARAATRARTSAGGAATPGSLDATDASPGLLLHPTALFTIREYGWAEVMTLFAQEADAGGMLEMEAHDLASGTAALYSRPAVGEPWTMVGVHPTCAISIIQELGGAVPTQLATAAAAAGVRLPSASAPTSPTTEKPGRANSLGSALAGLSGRAPQTLMALSAQLVSASEAVNAAAAQLRLFAEEVRAAMASAASTPASSGGGAAISSPGGMPHAALPAMVAAV